MSRCPACDREGTHEEGCRYVLPEHRPSREPRPPHVVHSGKYTQAWGCSCDRPEDHGSALGRIIPARATPSSVPPAAPLDVETMKQAIINVICGWQDEDHCGRDAEAIAAEYARLSSDTSEE
jgi:hypothetical protein